MATTTQTQTRRRLDNGQLSNTNPSLSSANGGGDGQSLQPSTQPSPPPPQNSSTRPRAAHPSHIPISLLYRPSSPAQNFGGHQLLTTRDPASPTQSVGSTGGGAIHRDERDAHHPDFSAFLPSINRQTTPTQNSVGLSNHLNNSPSPNSRGDLSAQPTSNSYPRAINRPIVDSPDMENNTISPAGSLRRMPREQRGSAGSADFVLPEGSLKDPQARLGEKDGRPGSRDRKDRDRDRERDKTKDIVTGERRTPTNQPAPNSSSRPQMPTFESTSTIKPMGAGHNYSNPDLIGGNQARASPQYRETDSREPTSSNNSRKMSNESIEPPNGESSGWVSYDTELSPQQGQWDRDRERDRTDRGRQPNTSYTTSRFSPDRFPLTEDPDRDEDLIPSHSIPRNGSNGSLNKVPSQPTTQSQPRRSLPIPGQQSSQGQTQLHSREPSGHQVNPMIPVVPKTQHSQIIQQSNMIRRPSSPLAREPPVQAHNSSEESDSYTPRSPPRNLPDIPPAPQQYGYQIPYQPVQSRDYRQQQQPTHPSQPAQPNRGTRPSNNNAHNMYDPHMQTPHRAAPQLPMYTGASMATALSSISPSQSVSAVGSPRQQPRQTFPYSNVLIPGQNTGRGKGGLAPGNMYPNLGANYGITRIPGGKGGSASLDQQIAALNAVNLGMLAQLTPAELRALGFGASREQQANAEAQGRDPNMPDTPVDTQGKPDPHYNPATRPKEGQYQLNTQNDTINMLEHQASEHVDLEDLQREMQVNLDWPHQHPHYQSPPQQQSQPLGGQVPGLQSQQGRGQGHARTASQTRQEQDDLIKQQQAAQYTQALHAMLGITAPGSAGSQNSQLPPSYPSSHGGVSAVKPNTGKDKAPTYEDLLGQTPLLGNAPINPASGSAGAGAAPPSAISSSHVHSRPINPIPPTPLSGHTGAYGFNNAPAANGAIRQGDGWIPIPNTDGYPPSYHEIIELFTRHNGGRQPTIQEVLAMQNAALASEPENVEGSVFSKTETPFPPVGFNPFLSANASSKNNRGYRSADSGVDSVRSSPRDPPGDFGGMLRRVPAFGQAAGRRGVPPPGSSVFGYGDNATEVSTHFAKSVTTEGDGDHRDDLTEDDLTEGEGVGANPLLTGRPNAKDAASTLADDLLRLSMHGGPGATAPVPGPTTTVQDLQSLYPLFPTVPNPIMSTAPTPQYHGPIPDDWVDEQDSDEDLEAELDMYGDDGHSDSHLHPKFVRDESKRRRKWEVKFAELVKAFHDLDRLTDTPMILLAAPPRPSINSSPFHAMSNVPLPPMKPHVALSRSIRRDANYLNFAHSARRSYQSILATPPTPRGTPGIGSESLRSGSSMTNSPPFYRAGSGGWSGSSPPSVSSQSQEDERLKARIAAALTHLKLLSKVEERREARRMEEINKQREERDVVERTLKGLLGGIALASHSANASSSSGGGGSGGAGSAGMMLNVASPGETISAGSVPITASAPTNGAIIGGESTTPTADDKIMIDDAIKGVSPPPKGATNGAGVVTPAGSTKDA